MSDISLTEWEHKLWLLLQFCAFFAIMSGTSLVIEGERNPLNLSDQFTDIFCIFLHLHDTCKYIVECSQIRPIQLTIAKVSVRGFKNLLSVTWYSIRTDKKIKFSSSYMVKCLRISSYIRKPFLTYDFASAPFRIFLYMRKIWFSFFFSALW